MARSAQTNTAHLRPVWHKRTFRDHAGRPATRLRYSRADEALPDNFKQSLLFAFQVYTTVSILTSASTAGESADGGDGPAAKRTKGESDVDVSMTPDLESLGEYLGAALSDAQRPSPVWEIYEPQTDALSCVDHQRREIAHRKATREENDTLLIPKVSKGDSDKLRQGFCIVITSESYHDKLGLLPNEHVDVNGPLWVWFDRRSALPRSSTSMSPAEGAEPQKQPSIEIEVERKQRTADMHSQLTQVYSFSCAPNSAGTGVGGVTLAADEDEGQPSSADSEAPEAGLNNQSMSKHASQLSLEDFDMQQQAAGLVVSNCSIAEPDLRYLVYMLLPGDGDELLEQAAKAFTSAVTSHLRQRTVSFEFRRSPEPTLSSMLGTSLSLPNNHIGALADSKRTYPLARRPDAWLNDPSSSPVEPYHTFLLVLDNPTDFIDGPGVLMLLTDGGKQRCLPTDQEGWFSGPTFDYIETAVWRCRGMESLASRLAMNALDERDMSSTK